MYIIARENTGTYTIKIRTLAKRKLEHIRIELQQQNLDH